MKILHIVRQFYPSIGGLESYLNALLREQKSLGYESEVLTLNKILKNSQSKLPPREFVNGTVVYRVPFIGKGRFFVPFFNPRRFRNYDLIHVHNTDLFFDICAWTKWLHNTPLVCTTHGGFFHTEYLSRIKETYFDTLTRASAAAYRCFFACSENDFRLFEKISDRVVLLQNAVDPLGNFECTGKDFLYIGRLSLNKRLDNLLQVHAELQKSGIIRHLHIIGPDFEITREALIAWAKDLGTENDVTVHGFLDDSKVEDIAKTCGYYVSASDFEGFGMALIETMAVGMLPLVHENESFKDLYRMSNLGVVTDFGNPPKAAADIAHFLAKDHAADKIAAQRFAKDFDWPHLATQLDRYYALVLHGQNPANSPHKRPNPA